MASRPNNLLYRHNASMGIDNEHPLLVMEREHAKRALRLLRAGEKLEAMSDAVRVLAAKFCWEEIARKTIEIYHKVIETRRIY